MQEQSLYGRLITVAIHVLVWAVFGLAIFYYQPLISDIEIPFQFWVKQTIGFGLLIITFYLNAALLVPRLLLRNHPAYYFLTIIVIVLAIVFAQRSLDRAYTYFQMHSQVAMPGLQRLGNPPPDRRRIPSSGGTMLTFTISALVIGISTAITAIQKSQRDNQERKEFEKEKISSELSFLKAQIQPHFFFNTLNNIYALTAVDPKLAGEAIHQLSRMMRYLLYGTQRDLTMLGQEIAFLHDYINLMRLRLTDAVSIVIDTPTGLNDIPIAPMIFLPFVENAFKHGVSATRPSFIDIRICQKSKIVDLTVKNSIMKDNKDSLDINSGIGLVNTRRRLDLLYPEKYRLDILDPDTTGAYSVHLVLDLS